MATEIEFYLAGDTEQATAAIAPFVLKWEKERGVNQYEIALHPSREVREVIRLTNHCKMLLRKQGADFSARPFADQPGSGLHVHVHLEDEAGRNLFTKNDETISEVLVYALGGLLATMRDYMPVFAPTSASLARFQPGVNAPTTVSWGANNRTTALRLPDSGPYKRIEHRVAGADADVEAVIEAVLVGIAYGIENKIQPGPQIYGDASLPMYGLPLLTE